MQEVVKQRRPADGLRLEERSLPGRRGFKAIQRIFTIIIILLVGGINDGSQKVVS